MAFRTWARALAVVCCVSSLANAATNSWTAVGPVGGLVQKVLYNPSNPSIVYMISAGGFQRSQDGGMTWQTIRNDFMNPPHDLAVDPADSSRVYVVVPNAPFLLVSTDSGATLSPVTSFPTNLVNTWQVQVSQDGATVCVAGGLSVVCSTNQGQSWGAVSSLGAASIGQIYALAMDPTHASTLYASGLTAAGTYGLYVTNDGAKTWQLLNSTTDPDSVALVLVVDPGTPARLWGGRNNGLWVSPNSGLMWSSVVFASGSEPVSAVTLNPANPANLFVGSTDGKIFTSPDGGTTWTEVTGNIAAGEIFTLAVHPTQASTLLAGGQVGVWGTVTGGTSWNAQVAGLYATDVTGLSADPISDRIYLNLSEGGLYCISNGADTAVAVNNAALGQSAGTSGAVTVSAFLAQAGSPGPVFASLLAGIARSGDGGNTWSLLPRPSLSGSQVFVLASSTATPQTILASTDSAYYRTTDGGNSWTAITAGLPTGAAFERLVVAPSDGTIVYGSPYLDTATTTNFGVYRSSDSGQTWSPANAGMETSAIAAIVVDPSNAAVVYAFTETAASAGTVAMKSTDGGNTWATWPMVAVPGTYLGTLAIDPVHPQILYAAATGAIVRSVDGGTTWETISNAQAVSEWDPSALLVDPNRPSDLLVATAAAGVQRITIAPDLSLQTATPSGPVAVGQATTYTYTVTNNGPFNASGVQVTLQLPAAAQGVAATSSAGQCTVTGTTETCSLGVLLNGASATIALRAIAPASGSFQLVGTVQADQPDPNTTNNSVTSNVTVTTVADVSVSATGTSTAQVGDAVVYTVTVTNGGPNTATATQLTYQLAAVLTPGTVSAGSGTCTTSASALITCNLGDLSASQSASITVNATAAAVGTAASTATVMTTATDPNAGNNSATSSTTVAAASSAPPTTPPSSGSTSSGGSHGGGGALSLPWLVALALLVALQKGAARSARNPFRNCSGPFRNIRAGGRG